VTGAKDWTGGVGDVWAAEWRRTDRSFIALTPILNAAILAVAPGDGGHIVDIGCGAGGTSLAITASSPQVRITGIDLSPSLIAVAQARAADRAPASRPMFVCGDVVATVAAQAPVDLYISRHGVMFFADPVVAFTALRKAAAPGGSILFSCFAERAANRWATETIEDDSWAIAASVPPAFAPGPFAFADASQVATMLMAAGWTPEPPRRVDFAYRAGEGTDAVADAVAYLSRIGPAASRIRDTTGEERDRAITRLTSACAARHAGDAVEFPAATWIWTA